MYYFPIKHSSYNRIYSPLLLLSSSALSFSFFLFCVLVVKEKQRRRRRKKNACCSIRTAVVFFFFLYSCAEHERPSFFFFYATKQKRHMCLLYINLKCQVKPSYSLYITITTSYPICKNKLYSSGDTIIFSYVFNGFFSSLLSLCFFSLCITAF